MTATDRLERLLALVPWLTSHPGATLAAAAQAFGTTEKAVEQDVNLLFCCGLPGGGPGDLIDFAFDGEGVTVLDPQLLDRPLALRAEEAMSLLVAVRALADVPGLSERAALERVAAKLEKAVGGDPGVTVVPAAADPETLAAVRSALGSGRRLHLRYLAGSRDEVTDRHVDPMQVLMSEGNWYLEGWCHRAGAVRLFRVDRIEAATVLAEASTPPPDAAPRAERDGLFTPSPDDVLVELELAPTARWVPEYYPTEYLREQAGGKAIVGLRVSDPAWARALVMRLGGRARVLAPSQLADEVRSWATAALAAYQV